MENEFHDKNRINAPNPLETETQTINVEKGVGNELLQQAHITNTILV